MLLNCCDRLGPLEALVNRLSRLYGCLALIGLTIPIFPSLATQANPAVTVTNGNMNVSFIGCNSDGQLGPLEAPKSAQLEVRLDGTAAGRLTLYEAEYGAAVLAPRGWFCFGTYGSVGATLYVTPEPLTSAVVLDSKWEGIKGSGVEAVTRRGDTSGRFEVARVVARVFPEQRAFVDKVIAEGIEPASHFPIGPFPSDHLTTLSNRIVEFVTPPQTQGLGSFNNMRPASNSISGVAILNGNVPDLSMMTLRLPQDLNDLTPIITRQFETAL